MSEYRMRSVVPADRIARTAFRRFSVRHLLIAFAVLGGVWSRDASAQLAGSARVEALCFHYSTTTDGASPRELSTRDALAACARSAQAGNALAYWWTAQAKLNLILERLSPNGSRRNLGGDSWILFSEIAIYYAEAERAMNPRERLELQPLVDDAIVAFNSALVANSSDAYFAEYIHQDFALVLLLDRDYAAAVSQLSLSLSLEPSASRDGFRDYDRLCLRCYVRGVLMHDRAGLEDCSRAGATGGVSRFSRTDAEIRQRIEAARADH